MAATYDRTSTQQNSVFEGGIPFVIENTVSIVVATTADVIQALKIPAGTYIGNVFMTIVTQSDAATSHAIDVGDGTDPNGWDNAVDVKGGAVGSITSGAAGTDAYVPTGKGTFPHFAKYYAAEDTIDLTNAIVGVPTVGSVKVQALCYKPLIGTY